MHIYSSNITDPHNEYFPLTLEGQVKKAGVFPAHLYFRKPTQVFWMTPPEAGEMQEVQLGHFDLDYVGVAAGHGRIKQKTVFHIDDTEKFALFTRYMITHEEFTWRLFCPDVHIEALSFIPTWSNLKLTKDVVFNGIDNFKDVEIVDFQMPNADKDGGIAFYATTLLRNPSPFGMQLGQIEFDLYYNGLLLGPALAPSLNLTPSLNLVNLQGRLLSYANNQTALGILGDLFTRYINGEVSLTYAVGRNVTAPSGVTPTWLQQGVQAINIAVPFKSPIAINPIKSITIKQFNLSYYADSAPYAPAASSDSLSAQIGLPFGFPLNIVSTKNEITLVDDKTNTPMAVVDGVYSNSATQLDIVASGQTAGTLYLTLRPSLMRLPEQTDAARKEFQYFQKEFVFSEKDSKLFNGSSVAVTDTPVGRIVLNGIQFSVESGLLGLQGLNHYPTTINSVDVIGGTNEGLKLAVNTTIINPSNVNVQSGNVTLLFLNHDVIGNVYLENLNLVIGENNVTAISTFSPKVSPYGYETLNRYVSGLDTPVNISGFEGSTPIDSLVPAFSAIRLNSTLDGLKTSLVQQASLQVLNTTGIKDDVAHSIVNLNNPFTAALQITHIVTNVSMHGIFVAQIDTDLDFSAAGKSVTPSPSIPLHLNLYPPDMFALVRALALQAGEDVRQLDGIVKIGGYTYSNTTSANSDRKPSKRSIDEAQLAAEASEHTLMKRKTNMYTGFNLPNFVDKAFSVASANLEIVSESRIGDYQTPITFSQQNVPMKTDDSLNLLLPVLAKPIVQKIIDGSNLVISRVTILNPAQNNFRVHLVGSITNAGPFDAVIRFPQGLQLSWNNQVLGQIAMPNIQLEAEDGAQIDLEAEFAVRNTDALTSFTKFLVTEPSFVWEITGEGLAVDAIGITTTDLTISKSVIMTGFNNLKNAVTITTVIKAIELNELTLMFTKKTAWHPATSSSNTQAPFYIPFGFPIDITEAGGGFIQGYKGTDLAILNIPMSPAVTDVQQRILTLKFNDVPFEAYGNKHSQFSGFLADTTAQKSVTFQLHGNADSVARTAAGVVTITDIPFSVSTSLDGLQNLNARPVVTSDLDVKHGYKGYLLITLKASLYNPSHITIGTGDVSFNLLYKNHPIGTAEISGLVLKPGLNNISTSVHYSPHGSSNVAAGQNLLENYVQGVVSTARISGSRDTTPIASLKEALSGIQLSTQIPPLHQLLIIEAKLVIPKNIAQTSTAQASFQLRNPFTASINLVKVNAKASYEGIYLGVIDQSLSPQIHAGGHTTITSRTLPLKMDLDPKHLIQFVEKAAANTNTDLGPLTEQFNKVMAMSSTKTTIQPYPDSNPPSWHSGRQFDVFSAVMSLLKGLKVTLDIQSTVKLDDYQTNLNFQQSPVPTDTDRTALYLIGPIGAPIVQNLVDQATLSFSMTNITKVRDDGFHLDLQGQLLNTGPFDAQIEFPEGVSVTWEGQSIATIQLPAIRAYAYEGAPNLRTTGELKITNQAGFTKFTTYILHNSDFTWTISTNKLRVRALNIVFDGVKISKTLHFKAFNGLPGVNITSFDIPGETSDSLKITTGTTIPSPATLGIDLETANFKIYFDGQYVGPVHSTNLFLRGQATTSALLHGFITHKSGNAQVQATGKLFSQYLQGKNSQLSVKGDSVVTRENGNKAVGWLSKAFQTLTLNLVLPGHIYKIVYSVTISDLYVTMMQQSQAWAPLTGSNQSVAVYANPFQFSLTPLKASLQSKLIYQNAVAATLSLSMRTTRAGTSRGPNDHEPLILSWKNVPLIAQDHSAFTAVFAQLLNTPRASVGVSGTAGLIAKMVIGNIPIDGIPFNVTSSLGGFNSFTRNATLQRLDVKEGTPKYLDNTGKAILHNPSNITVHTTGISLPAFYKNTYVGRALLNNKIIAPGDNYLDSIVRYQPNNPNDTVAQELLVRYAQPQMGHGPVSIPFQTPVVIKGTTNADPPLSPFASLIPALEGIYVASSVPGIATRVLNQIDSYFDALTLFSAPGFRPYIYIALTFRNDFAIPQTFQRIQSDASQYGTYRPFVASFTENAVTNCRIPAATATKVNPGFHRCDPIHNVLAPQGLIGSLPTVGKNLNVYTLVQLELGDNGYVAEGFQFNEEDVLTTYALAVGDLVIANITTIEGLIDGLLGALTKIPSSEVTKITESFAKLGTEGITKLASSEWKQVRQHSGWKGRSIFSKRKQLGSSKHELHSSGSLIVRCVGDVGVSSEKLEHTCGFFTTAIGRLKDE
ncbi:hypothetical protein MBRA1_003192 [Malassezia brasiliensis]|uniref:Uncharacterized protein n=1 Tax=Malassezia brasiliensis TaxID=1821822 RepID=A0AAF0DVH7_9BASI|nr:hypothetical protein MBRA1_003192 [Malassezia brasiliensis]